MAMLVMIATKTTMGWQQRNVDNNKIDVAGNVTAITSDSHIHTTNVVSHCYDDRLIDRLAN